MKLTELIRKKREVGVVFAVLAGAMLLNSTHADDRQTLRAPSEADRSSEVEQAAQTANQSLRSDKPQMQLTDSQIAALKRMAARNERIAGQNERQLRSVLEQKRSALAELLTPDQQRKIKMWERQASQELAAAGVDDGTEGPITFLACVTICQLACSDCDCEYCIFALPVPDP
jgi:predicted nucleic acid-binding protein